MELLSGTYFESEFMTRLLHPHCAHTLTGRGQSLPRTLMFSNSSRYAFTSENSDKLQ